MIDNETAMQWAKESGFGGGEFAVDGNGGKSLILCCTGIDPIKAIAHRAMEEAYARAARDIGMFHGCEDLVQRIVNLMSIESEGVESIKQSMVSALLPDNFSPSKDWKESDVLGRIQWLKETVANNRDELGRLQSVIDSLLAKSQNNPTLGKELAASDLVRGALVRWEWSASSGDRAEKLLVRPLGRVITREDLPCLQSGVEVAIQTLDDPGWVIDPATMFLKGRKIYAAEDLNILDEK